MAVRVGMDMFLISSGSAVRVIEYSGLSDQVRLASPYKVASLKQPCSKIQAWGATSPGVAWSLDAHDLEAETTCASGRI